jgi:hypothetical protein
MKDQSDDVFRVESPSFYRLSQDLARYSYPARLNIQKVELDPDCDCRYSSVDDQVGVMVTLGGVTYDVLVLSPNSAHSQHVYALPWNTVLVPRISGLTVAQAVTSAVERGLGEPRRDRHWVEVLERLVGPNAQQLATPRGTLPSLAKLAEVLGAVKDGKDRLAAFLLVTLRRVPQYLDQNDKIEVYLELKTLYEVYGLKQSKLAESSWRNVFRQLRWKPDARPLDIVEILLCRPLPLTCKQYHGLAHDIYDLWQRVGREFVPWPE